MQTRRLASREETAAKNVTLFPAHFSGSRIRTHLRTLSGRQVYLWSTGRGRSRQVIKH